MTQAEELSATPSDQPVEIADDYERDLEEVGVEDETQLEPPSENKFSITSYGADYTVDMLVSRLKNGSFFVPEFQRSFVWSQRHASRFIESLLMGLPVPGVFLYREAGTNKHLVVDGQQRLKTLEFFYKGIFLEKNFRLSGVQSAWNEKTYEELDAPDRLKLDDSIIHATIFQQDVPAEAKKSLYFVFERINSGGIRLSPQEIRNCISDGPLLRTIRELNDDKNWRNAFSAKKNARLKDHELILRFLALHSDGDRYKRPMKEFLNNFASENSDPAPDVLEKHRVSFKSAIKVCWDAMQKTVFRPTRSLNAAIFEGVMLGVASRLANVDKPLSIEEARVCYNKLLADPSFLQACEMATANEDNVKTRRIVAISAFSGN